MNKDLPSFSVPYAVLVTDNRRMIRGNGRNGHYTLGKAYRQAMHDVALLAKVAWRKRLPLTGPVLLELRFHVPDRRKRDMSNFLKLLHDAMSGIVYCDDQQITQETWIKVGLDRANPRVDIHIWDGSV